MRQGFLTTLWSEVTSIHEPAPLSLIAAIVRTSVAIESSRSKYNIAIDASLVWSKGAACTQFCASLNAIQFFHCFLFYQCRLGKENYLSINLVYL